MTKDDMMMLLGTLQAARAVLTSATSRAGLDSKTEDRINAIDEELRKFARDLARQSA